MTSQITEKLKASMKRLATKLQRSSASFSESKSALPMQETKADLEKPLSVAYQLMGDKTARFMPLFKDLDRGSSTAAALAEPRWNPGGA